jgi:hypothetical protein
MARSISTPSRLASPGCRPAGVSRAAWCRSAWSLRPPGDLVIADAEGVAFLPAHRAADVISAAERIAEKERRMAAEIRQGTPITVVMGPGYEQMLGTSW